MYVIVDTAHSLHACIHTYIDATLHARSCVCVCVCVCAGADPENLHGRWLTGWLPIVNYISARGVAG